MSTIIMDPDAVQCPLCLEKFEKAVLGAQTFYFCRKCKVSINMMDPRFNRWHELTEEKCPICSEPFRKFSRAIDGFEVIKCEKCQVASYRGKAEFLPPED